MPPSIASCINAIASASLSLLSPMCAPPKPNIDTHSPVEPSLRFGTPAEDCSCAETPVTELACGVCAEASEPWVAFCPGALACLRHPAKPIKPESDKRQKSARVKVFIHAG